MRVLWNQTMSDFSFPNVLNTLYTTASNNLELRKQNYASVGCNCNAPFVCGCGDISLLYHLHCLAMLHTHTYAHKRQILCTYCKHNFSQCALQCIIEFDGMIANERRRYIVTSSRSGGAHTQNDPWIWGYSSKPHARDDGMTLNSCKEISQEITLMSLKSIKQKMDCWGLEILRDIDNYQGPHFTNSIIVTS